jgi:hypothetical protein
MRTNLQHNPETYLTPREAAEYLRSSPSTLAKRRWSGNGPIFVRLGTAIRYRVRDLDSWMAISAARSTSSPPSSASLT